MRLGAAPNLSGSAGSTALNTLSLRWLAFVSSSDATVASSVLCAPQLPWPVPRMVVSSCACGFFPLVVANSMANCGKVEKSSTPGPRRESQATFVQNAGLCTTRGSRRAQCPPDPLSGDRPRPRAVARVLNRAPARRRPRGARSVARPARLCAVRVRAPAPSGRRNRFCASHVVFKWKVVALSGNSRHCGLWSGEPLWSLVRHRARR